MTTQQLREKAREVLDRLDAISQGIVVPFPCWLGGDGADQGPSYCRGCAEKHVDNSSAEFVDGGFQQDNDGCCHCEDCGRPLDYTLTEYGIKEELEHFAIDDLKSEVTPELAYHLCRLLEHYASHPEVLVIIPKVDAALNPAREDVK